ncbi:hypothetical protein AM24_110 [Acinetobacter phage AM24]|nr:hypothetical protein AM24_110 [Acinetobacter phage AM24]
MSMMGEVMKMSKDYFEEVLYCLDGYVASHNERNFGDADEWLRHVRNDWEKFTDNHDSSLNPLEHYREELNANKVFAAVHVITESCDHYNYLLEVQDCSDLIEQLISSLGHEFAHICDVYVTMPDDFDTNAVEASIMCRSAKYLEGGDD